MPKFLTNEEKSEILLKSDRYTARQLAEQYGCSRSMILKIWMENNYHKPKSFNYYVNNQYFNTIDSPIKAYALGLIASDGNLYKRNSQQGQIKIYLEKTDEEVLRLILKDMGSTHPIKSTETTNFTLRMPVSQRFQLECIAKNQGRTITNLINYVMSQYIED